MRLERLLNRLETYCDPTVVLLESRNGLHDIAAATVTHLDAEILLFAIDSASNWTALHWTLIPRPTIRSLFTGRAVSLRAPRCAT